MIAYIAIFLSLISIILLISVMVRFKKLFSTDAIIEKTKVHMNKIISDINKNANMDIDLINEATKRTRALMVEAESKMEEFKEAAGILRDMIATVQNENKMRTEQSHIYNKSFMDDIKPIGQVSNHTVTNADYNAQVVAAASSAIQARAASYGAGSTKINAGNSGYNAASYRAKAYQSKYKDAFDDNDLKTDIPSEEENKSEEYMIPKIVTNIIPDNDNVSKKSLNEKVERLFRTGMNAEDIALELSCSSSEVQFIIDMLSERG